MNYEFELIEIDGPNLFQGQYDQSDAWQWVRFVFTCKTSKESVRVPTQVMIPNFAIMHWDENDHEIQRRAYSFLRRNFELVFQDELRNGLAGLAQELKEAKLVWFKITSADQADSKLDVNKGDKFMVRV